MSLIVNVKNIFFINDWRRWYFIDDKTYNLFKATLLFYFFDNFLPSSLNTYQSMKSIAFAKTNTDFYCWAKLFYKSIQSAVNNTTTILIIYRNASICIMMQISVILTKFYIIKTRTSVNANYTKRIFANCLN